MRVQEPQKPRAREYWRDIPGYGGEYQASTEGRIRRRKPNGSGWDMVEIRENESGRKPGSTVWLRQPDGDWREHGLLRIIAMTWYPEAFRPELDVMHRNGLHADNSARNVLIVERGERMRRQALGWNRRAVYHVDARHGGKILEIYPTASAAAEATGLTPTCVIRHCRGKHKQRRDGTTFRYAARPERKKVQRRGNP